jgi:hypothetical protein
MAFVLEQYSTEQQRSAVRFIVGKRIQCKDYSQINISCLLWEIFVA